MTREEMIKALRCCANPALGSCGNCPYWEDNVSCIRKLTKDAADLLESDLHESKSGKTADEMFRELGYEMEGENNFNISYKEKNAPSVITYNKEMNIFSCTMYGQYYGFTPEELRAVCRLLDEIGVS